MINHISAVYIFCCTSLWKIQVREKVVKQANIWLWCYIKNYYYYQRIIYTVMNWTSKFWGIYNDWKKFKTRTQCSGLHKTMEIHQYWEGNGCSGRWEVLVEAESTVIQWGAPSSPERHRLWSRWPHPVCSVSSGKTMQPFHLTLTSPLPNSYQWDESWIP